jgi:hypothetical protein
MSKRHSNTPRDREATGPRTVEAAICDKFHAAIIAGERPESAE